MIKPTKECDAFVVDTYRSSERGYVPSAITMRKRRNVEVLQWKKSFTTEDDANIFVRAQLEKIGIPEHRE